uniref:Uncharacterized protein n=1 Tax=Medicago truncatula TaxID=3880 RepID=Q2HSC9_MEDTR|nr:hypothetical protein MtrDRAFT_AC151598g53v2 [Medicago truncatula]
MKRWKNQFSEKKLVVYNVGQQMPAYYTRPLTAAYEVIKTMKMGKETT